MKRFLNVPALILTAILSAVLIWLMAANEVDMTQRVIGVILFALLNYLVLSLLLRGLRLLLRVLRLPELKVRTYAYHLYPVALLVLYAAFLLVMARLADYRISAYQLAGIIVTGVVALIIAQLGGAFPDRRISAKKRALRLENAGGMLGGFEILGSLTGTYRDGVVLGVDEIPFSLLDRIHRSGDSILIEGSVDPKVELIIVAEKAQNYFIDVLADRLKASRSGLMSSQAKPKSSMDRIKSQKSGSAKAKERQRAKPVKLIEKQEQEWARKKAGEQAKAQTGAKFGDAQGKPKA